MERLLAITTVPDFRREIERSDEPTIVMFTTSWCPFCRRFKPRFVEAATKSEMRWVMGYIDDWDNPLLDGGFNETSTTVVIGRSGAGKTTLATQFIRRGLHEGQEGIFVSLDENKEQIIREAVEMGWSDILGYLDEELLVFIDASGREFGNFIRKELPAFVADWQGANARIAVDPLTPVMWSTKDAYEQRELIGFMLKETRKVGTVLCTLERSEER